MRHGRPTLLPAIVVVLLATIGLAPAVSAHESSPAGVQRTELSLGDHRIVLTVTAPPPGGGRADVAVTPRGPDAAGAVGVAVARAGAPAGPATVLPVDAVGRTSRATLAMPDPGAWEVVVADGTGVTDTARVPVAVATTPATPAGVWVFWAALLIGVASLVVAVGPGTRRRPRVATAVGALAVAGLTLAVTLAVVGVGRTTATPPAAAAPDGHDHGAVPGAVPGAMPMPTDAPMSPAMSMPAEPGAVAATVRPSGPPPAPGRPTDLVLDLTDASSGAVVDDLAVHDDALVHLAVIGPAGQLAHVHPVRVAPGRYAVRFTPETAGRHGVFAEMQRAGDGGHRIARTAFDVPGPAAQATDPAAVPAPGPGPHEVDGLRVDVAVSSTAAGRPSRITATVGETGRPVTDLQAWLGMAGHLMVLGPGVAGAPDPGDPASTFGHVHDMSAPGPAGTYGPQVGFDHTFPRAGRYALWVQVQHDWRTVTVPVTVDVGPDTAT